MWSRWVRARRSASSPFVVWTTVKSLRSSVLRMKRPTARSSSTTRMHAASTATGGPDSRISSASLGSERGSRTRNFVPAPTMLSTRIAPRHYVTIP